MRSLRSCGFTPSPTGALDGVPGSALANMSGQVNPRAALLGAALGQDYKSLTRRARRLHIGNLPLNIGLTTDQLKQFLNVAMVAAKLHDESLPSTEPDGPVLDFMITGEGKYGFAEFRTIAECTSCVALHNIELGGKQLRIERPRDYLPMPADQLDGIRASGYLGNTVVAPDGQDLLAGAPPPGPSLSSNPLGSLGLPPPPSGGLALPAPPSLPELDTSNATTVVKLSGMLTDAEVTSAQVCIHSSMRHTRSALPLLSHTSFRTPHPLL